MNKKLQVFISSTYIDLKKERQAAVEAILSAGHIPAGMELFTASDESQMEVIKRWIDESDVYLLILGVRYGAIEPKTKKSYTQLEYEYAIETNKPLFAIAISDDAFKNKLLEYNALGIENHDKYLEFRKKVLSKMIKLYDDEKDIKLAIHTTLNDFQLRNNLTGWVSGKETENSKYYADQLASLTEQNRLLQSKIESLTKQNNQLINQKTNTTSKITYTINTDITNRVDRILELIGADEQNSLTWYDDNIEYSVKDATGNFEYYFVYLPCEIIGELPDIDYTLVLSLDSLNKFDISDELASIRVMLRNHKPYGDYMKFKYVIASNQISSEIEEQCKKFFDNALANAKIKNKGSFIFETWNDKALSEMEENFGLKISL